VGGARAHMGKMKYIKNLVRKCGGKTSLGIVAHVRIYIDLKRLMFRVCVPDSSGL